jgi:hypothetical protein
MIGHGMLQNHHRRRPLVPVLVAAFERWASGAAGSRSNAEAVRRRLHAVVSCGTRPGKVPPVGSRPALSLPPAPGAPPLRSSLGGHPLAPQPRRPHRRHSRHPRAWPPAAARDHRPRCASLATSVSPTTSAAGDAVPSPHGPGGHGSLLALPRPVSLSPQVTREQGASGQLVLRTAIPAPVWRRVSLSRQAQRRHLLLA